METIDIKYSFGLKGRPYEFFDLQLSPETLEQVNLPSKDLPEWTRLDFHTCPHCSLVDTEARFCPAAVSLVDLVTSFGEVVSYEQIDLQVVTANRKVYERTSAQKGISSLLGLLLSTSGCPHMACFKPMARFHLPLSSPLETMFRASGMYLLAQYFKKNDGQESELGFEGLTKIYEKLHLLNIYLAKRIKSAISNDSSINAVIILDVFTQTMPNVIKDQLEMIRPLFKSYLSEPSVSINKKD